jgi:hypothetical protein
VFLRADLQPAAAELSFAESAAGYAQLRARLEQIVTRSAGIVQFTLRLDAAGQYADNLLHFLQTLSLPGASCTISRGDPLRNKHYRAALFGRQKSDPVDALAMARYALSEQPSSSAALSLEQRLLRFPICRTAASPRFWPAPVRASRRSPDRRPSSSSATRCGNCATAAHARNADQPTPETKQAAGLKPEIQPAVKEVATACDFKIAPALPRPQASVDFAHLKRQLPLARVLDQLGLTAKLRGSRLHRRCACPIHRGDGRGRTFSVNLVEHVFHCFQASCGQQGGVIDLWAALHSLSLPDAALDLVQTFQLEPAPPHATEKRHG